VPSSSGKVREIRVCRYTPNIGLWKFVRKVLESVRSKSHSYSQRPAPAPSPAWGLLRSGGDGSGGSSCARMRAEAATGRTAPRAEVKPAAERLRSFAESSAHRQPPAARQMHPATGRRCESVAARMVGGGTHFDRGRDFQPPVLPSQSRRTSHDNRAAPCGSEMEPPTQPRPPVSCLPLCPHCAPAPCFRPLSRGSTTQKPRFTDRLQTNA
jgi:hypothetical protein